MEVIYLYPLPILLFISLLDVKKRIVPEIPVYFLLLSSSIIFLITLDSLKWALSTLFLFAVSFFLYIKGAIADGDFALLTSLSFLIKDISIFFILFFSVSFMFLLIYSISRIFSRDKTTAIFLIILATILVLSFFVIPLFSLIILSTIIVVLMTKRRYLEEVKEIGVNELMEGDILAEDIEIDGKIVFKNPGRSLTNREIEKIKSLGVEKVKIKWGAPFVVAITITFFIYSILA